MNAKTAAFVISAIFILPFVLFSATSGQLSDKYDKARVMRLVKSLEIAIMLIGGAGFLLHDVWLLYAGTFLMGVHSTLFGPVKYAYLPQQLNERELVGGNGMIEMGTFVAILIGTIIGGELADLGVHGPIYVAAVCLGVAIVGRVVVSFVPASPSDQPDLKINWNPFTETWRNLELARENRSVFLSLLGISWLWFFGATFLTSFFNFAKDVLGGDPQVVTLLLAIFSIGIGIGSLLCEKLSRGKVEIGLVPAGSIGMTVFAVDLWWASRGLQPIAGGDGSLVGAVAFVSTAAHRVAHWHVMIDLFLLAMFGGLYSVPLYAMIQSRSAAVASRPHHRGEQHPQLAVHDRVVDHGDRAVRVRLHDSRNCSSWSASSTRSSRSTSTRWCPSSCCASSRGSWSRPSIASAPAASSTFRPKGRRCWCATTSASSMR